jgi:hypothetical protein
MVTYSGRRSAVVSYKAMHHDVMRGEVFLAQTRTTSKERPTDTQTDETGVTQFVIRDSKSPSVMMHGLSAIQAILVASS